MKKIPMCVFCKYIKLNSNKVFYCELDRKVIPSYKGYCPNLKSIKDRKRLEQRFREFRYIIEGVK